MPPASSLRSLSLSQQRSSCACVRTAEREAEWPPHAFLQAAQAPVQGLSQTNVATKLYTPTGKAHPPASGGRHPSEHPWIATLRHLGYRRGCYNTDRPTAMLSHRRHLNCLHFHSQLRGTRGKGTARRAPALVWRTGSPPLPSAARRVVGGTALRAGAGRPPSVGHSTLRRVTAAAVPCIAPVVPAILVAASPAAARPRPCPCALPHRQTQPHPRAVHCRCDQHTDAVALLLALASCNAWLSRTPT